MPLPPKSPAFRSDPNHQSDANPREATFADPVIQAQSSDSWPGTKRSGSSAPKLFPSPSPLAALASDLPENIAFSESMSRFGDLESPVSAEIVLCCGLTGGTLIREFRSNVSVICSTQIVMVEVFS